MHLFYIPNDYQQCFVSKHSASHPQLWFWWAQVTTCYKWSTGPQLYLSYHPPFPFACLISLSEDGPMRSHFVHNFPFALSSTLDVSKGKKKIQGCSWMLTPNMIWALFEDYWQRVLFGGAHFRSCMPLLFKIKNNGSKIKINSANYFLIFKMLSLCNLKLTSLAGNPSTPGCILVFTASIFIDKNYKSSCSLQIRSFRQ